MNFRGSQTITSIVSFYKVRTRPDDFTEGDSAVFTEIKKLGNSKQETLLTLETGGVREGKERVVR